MRSALAELGPELAGGEFVRQRSTFRQLVGSAELPAVAGRYHLYVARACPWSHRVMIVRKLKRLERAISISYAHPYRDERGWHFPGGEFADRVEGVRYLREAYEATAPGFEGRVSVPVLWDRETRRIVNNESGEIMRMLGSAFDEHADASIDLYPRDLRTEIDELGELIYERVNNGVYRAGFAGTQEAYERAYHGVFDTLADIERRLSTRRYLTGERVTEVDWRLWVTLVRFDAVYHTHFRLNGRRIVDLPNLWGFTRDLYQRPGIADTLALDEIKRHYYTTHDSLNPKRIIPAGPEDLDFATPHGRA